MVSKILFSALLVSALCMSLASKQAAAKDSIRIASIYAHTGIAAMDNQDSVRGVRLGVQGINARGGILGREIELIELDNRSTPIGSKVAADEAVSRDVTGIIGADWSSHSIPMARVAQAHGIPMISNVSTNTKVTRTGDYIFRACFTDPFQGRMMARFSREDLKAATVVIFTNITSDFSMELSAEFRRSFHWMGGKVLTQVEYRHKQENFREIAAAVGVHEPDIVFLSGQDESALILKEVMKRGSSAIPIGGDSFGTQSFFLRGGKDLMRAYYSTHWARDLNDPYSKAFVKTYEGLARLIPQTALAYDAVRLLADAIHRAKTTDRKMIRECLAATRNFRGVTGRISFDDNGDPIKSGVIMEIKNGHQHYLKSVHPR